MQPSRASDPRVDLLRQLGDPVRLGVLDRLAEGPATVSDLAAHLDVGVPHLSNQLRRLREAGLLEVEQVGRQRVYRASDPRVTVLLSKVDDLVGGGDRIAAAASTAATPPFVLARTCYDHLAGRLGVAVFDRLVALEAIRCRRSEVELGPAADAVMSGLGVATVAPRATRRRFATACPDGTEGAPHLGGALGAALAAAVVERGWVRRRHGRRDVEVTPAGRAGLRRVLQLADFSGSP